MADSDRMENDETNIRITHKPRVGMQYKLVSWGEGVKMLKEILKTLK